MPEGCTSAHTPYHGITILTTDRLLAPFIASYNQFSSITAYCNVPQVLGLLNLSDMHDFPMRQYANSFSYTYKPLNIYYTVAVVRFADSARKIYRTREFSISLRFSNANVNMRL